MKKIILSSVLAANLLVASDYNYEITPMVGYVDTKEHVDIENHMIYGVGVARNLEEGYKFDKLEIGLMQSGSSDYEHSKENTKITLLSLNGIKEYKINEAFNLYALAGLGYERISNTQYRNESDPFFNYGVGAAYSFTEKLALKLDVRHELKFDGDRDVIYTLGLAIPFGQKSSNTPADLDGDNDGVLDSIDQCPTTQAGVNVDANGCAIVVDSDNDGIVDSEDQCPNSAAGAVVDASGCEIDSDNDGVVDSQDQCRTTKEGAEVDANGCTIIPLIDTDNDGVLDSIDQCPTTQSGVQVDLNGCEILVQPAQLNIVFKTNSDKIKTSDITKFEKYVNYTKRVDSAKIILEAHTDSIGTAAYNLNLSKRRADSAKKQLVSMGVDSNKIEAVGYGETKPLVSNDTAQNRAKNRRVTARIEK